jgi:hypothetical protein
MKSGLYFVFFLIGVLVVALNLVQCRKDDDPAMPEIRLIFDQGYTKNGDTIEIGGAVKFRVEVKGSDANITNFTVKKLYNGITKTVLDSGLNSTGFTQNFTFYQSVEDIVEWKLSVMDRNRNEVSSSIIVYKDPNSQFGGIYELFNIRMGYQLNETHGHFFLPVMNKVLFGDSAQLYQDQVDILVYFNYREDLGILKPSPTFSSPGEEVSATGELYDEYYPDLKNWTTRNYTKYDIRAINGVTEESFSNAHNDSLLIVSYDDVWGKKKYKWAYPGTYIPIQTAAGKKGIIQVIEADTVDTGTILFSLKIQM